MSGALLRHSIGLSSALTNGRTCRGARRRSTNAGQGCTGTNRGRQVPAAAPVSRSGGGLCWWPQGPGKEMLLPASLRLRCPGVGSGRGHPDRPVRRRRRRRQAGIHRTRNAAPGQAGAFAGRRVIFGRRVVAAMVVVPARRMRITRPRHGRMMLASSRHDVGQGRRHEERRNGDKGGRAEEQPPAPRMGEHPSMIGSDSPVNQDLCISKRLLTRAG